MARIVEYVNPFDGTEKILYKVKGGKFFINWLREVYPEGFPQPTVVSKNGKQIQVDDYDFKIKNKDVICLYRHIEDPVTLTTLAIVAVVGIAATLITLNNLPRPEDLSSTDFSPTSPSNSVRGQSNIPRFGEPIPSIYGRRKIYPDLAMIPWTEYIDNELFLHQLFMIGHGEYDIKIIRLGETDINSLLEVTTETIAPGGSVTLFDDNMYQSKEVKNIIIPDALAGFRFSDKMVFDKTAKSITNHPSNAPLNFQRDFRIGDDFWIRDFTGGDAVFNGEYVVDGFLDQDTITVTDASPWPSGTTTTTPSVLGEFILVREIAPYQSTTFPGDTPIRTGDRGPYVTNPPGTTITEVFVDIEFPRGLFRADETTGEYLKEDATIRFQFREIDDDGAPITSYGPISPTPSISDFFEGTTNQPQRRTINLVFPGAGRFELVVGRSDGAITEAQVVEQSVWTGLKARLTNVEKFGQFTMVAVTVRASGQISSDNSNKFNAIVTRKLPIWNGSSFNAPIATQSIAWALADIWMAAYGGARSFNDIDLDGLVALDAIWAARGDTFNAIFDTPITVWEALQKTARAGRARPVLLADQLSIIRDENQTVRTAMFTPRNITKGSFSIDYNFDNNNSPDGYRVKFIDNETWKEDFVITNVDATRPKVINLFGVTDYDQAWKEAQYLDAIRKFQRRTIKFVTELDGHIPIPGDLIAVTHDMPEWGQGGELIEVSPDGLTITTSEPLDFTGAPPFKAVFRKENGSTEGPIDVTQGSGDFEMVLPAPLSFAPITSDPNKEKTYYTFGPSDNFTQDCIVVSITPRGKKKVELQCVNFDQQVHDADTGPVVPRPGLGDTTLPIPPKISGLQLSSVPLSGIIDVSWNQEFNISSFRVESSTDNQSWVLEGSPTTNIFSISKTGLNYVRVAAVISGTVGEFISGNITMT